MGKFQIANNSAPPKLETGIEIDAAVVRREHVAVSRCRTKMLQILNRHFLPSVSYGNTESVRINRQLAGHRHPVA